jgi:hypothetical protein
MIIVSKEVYEMEMKVTEGFLNSFRELDDDELESLKEYYLTRLADNNDLVDVKWLFAICAVLKERGVENE